ncbi:hypothetical protein SSX86_000026 [Deinandra increscens subsp. villosa]|uniref:RNA-directed DNA polymerase, eukaryota n=1 Tax=Deinandra increscens subsp. villosa TaxID=3103831 RepID=A0AAP0DTR4_9ASTR
MQKVNSTFVVNDRVVWIEIAGLPLWAWSSDTFSAIASKWGKVCFVDNDVEEPLSSGKVCILAPSHKRINETITCVIIGVNYEVSVNEYEYWSPTFDCPNEDDVSSEEEDSDVNSVLDDSKDNNFFASYDNIWDNVNGDVNDENAHVGPVGVDEGIDVVNTATNSVFHADEATSKKATNSDPFGIMDYINNFELNKEYSLSLSVPPGFNRIDNMDDGVVIKTDIDGVHGNDPPSHVHLAADHVECKLKENSEEQQNSSKASSSNSGEQQNSSVNGGSLCRSNPVIRKEGDAPGFTNATFSGLSSKQGGKNPYLTQSVSILELFNKYIEAEADCFNDFIDSHDLVDVNLGGFKFTRISSNGLQQSKLDRFLVSASICSRFSGLEGLVLSNKVADHRPILLRIRDKDFGPIPFKFFNFWINLEGYEATVKQGWDDPCHLAHSNCFIRFKEKLKCVKNLLKAWNKDRRNL